MKMDNERSVLTTHLRTDLTVRNWIAVILFVGAAIWTMLTPNKSLIYSDFDLLWIFGPIVLGLVLVAWFQVFMNKGYRLSYDYSAVYFRPDGINWRLRYYPEQILRYEDIDKIIAEQGNANIKPFEFIMLWRATWDGKEEFWVSRMFLKDEEIREFLRFLYTKCPNKFPDDVIEFMELRCQFTN